MGLQGMAGFGKIIIYQEHKNSLQSYAHKGGIENWEMCSDVMYKAAPQKVIIKLWPQFL